MAVVGPVCSITDSGGVEVYSCKLCSVFTGRSLQSVLTHIGKAGVCKR